MQIIAPNLMQRVVEHDRILRRLLAQKAPEWKSLSGIRRLIARIRIELWAWRETEREQRRIHQNESPYKM